MTQEKRDTVGALASKLAAQEPMDTDPIELEREVHKNYEQLVYEAITDGVKKYAHDFYVVVLTKKERLMPNVLRHYFLTRHTCPTPEYDQTVYKYHKRDGKPEFLWVIPSKDTCEFMRKEALSVPDNQKQLLQFVLDFYDDTLLAYAKRLNNERVDTPILQQGA